jgi:hypothetical protein
MQWRCHNRRPYGADRSRFDSIGAGKEIRLISKRHFVSAVMEANG